MGAVLLLLVQAAASPPLRIDLSQPAVASGCRRAAGDEIMVCGRRKEPYRLPRSDDRFATRSRVKAETGLFGGAAAGAIETEAVQMPGGLQSNRVMARIRLPF